jgi:hypothetical protein
MGTYLPKRAVNVVQNYTNTGHHLEKKYKHKTVTKDLPHVFSVNQISSNNRESFSRVDSPEAYPL